MKLIKLMFVILYLMSSTAYTQEYENFTCRESHAKNDLEYHNLKGQVKSIKEFSIKAKKQDSETKEYEFVKPEILDTIAYIRDIFFDNTGKITSIKTDQIIADMFDSAGFLEERCAYSEAGEIENISYYTVLSDKVQDKNFLKEKDTKTVYVSNWETGIDAYSKQRILYYDSKGNIIKETVTSDNAIGAETTTLYEYNEDNNMTKLTSLNRGEKTIQWDYYYDQKGRLIQSEFKRFEASDIRETSYEYDEYGNVITINLQYEEENFNYIYDDYGNWISREKLSYNGRIKEEIIRNIKYYDNDLFVQDPYKEAIKQFQLGNFKEAEALFTQAIHTNNNVAYSYLVRGQIKGRLKRFKEAINDFSKALSLDSSQELYIKFIRGITYIETDEFGNAISDLNRVIELDSEFDNAYFFRGKAKTLMHNQLLEYIDTERMKITQKDKGESKTTLLIDDAIDDLDKAISQNKAYPESYFYRGILYGMQSNFVKSCQDFQNAIALDFEVSDDLLSMTCSKNNDAQVTASKFVNYETGETTEEEISGKIIEIVNTRKFIFQESETNEKITVRLAWINPPREGETHHERTIDFLKERVLNKEVTIVRLFEYKKEENLCPAFIKYLYQTHKEKGPSEGAVTIGQITFNESRYLNVDILEGGYAKMNEGVTISPLVDAEKKAKEYKIGVWSTDD